MAPTPQLQWLCDSFFERLEGTPGFTIGELLAEITVGYGPAWSVAPSVMRMKNITATSGWNPCFSERYNVRPKERQRRKEEAAAAAAAEAAAASEADATGEAASASSSRRELSESWTTMTPEELKVVRKFYPDVTLDIYMDGEVAGDPSKFGGQMPEITLRDRNPTGAWEWMELEMSTMLYAFQGKWMSPLLPSPSISFYILRTSLQFYLRPPPSISLDPPPSLR